MKKVIYLLLIIIFISGFTLYVNAATYDLNFSTYLGGSAFDHARDICADNSGNVYVAGGTASPNFPTTAGAYDTTLDPGYTGGFGPCDAFVTKFDSNGSLIWSTYLGGSGYDRAYAVEVDDSGYVYVAGRAGTNFPVTSGVFQTTFEGQDNGNYGWQNGFVAKLSPDGSNLIWASYVGVSTLCRDMAIDKNGNIYLPFGYWASGSGNLPPSSWLTNAFQSTTQGGSDCGAIKVSNDGSQVIWATFIGGSADEAQEASIRVDDSEYVYIAFCTYSDDMPTTVGAHDSTINGTHDFYVAKLTPDGTNLVYGTYIGDSGDNWNNTHNLAIDNQRNAYISVCATGSDFPTTSGATYSGGSTDWGLAKFSPTGNLIACTLIGGNNWDNPDGIYADDSGNVFLTGGVNSDNFPVTADAYQSSHGGGGGDAVLVMLSSDFSQMLYSTFLGGSSDDGGRTGFLDKDVNMYVAGTSFGSGWPTLNAFKIRMLVWENKTVLLQNLIIIQLQVYHMIICLK